MQTLDTTFKCVSLLRNDNIFRRIIDLHLNETSKKQSDFDKIEDFLLSFKMLKRIKL